MARLPKSGCPTCKCAIIKIDTLIAADIRCTDTDPARLPRTVSPSENDGGRNYNSGGARHPPRVTLAG